MEEIVTSLSDIGLTIVGLVACGVIIYLLDKYVFNKNRYK